LKFDNISLLLKNLLLFAKLKNAPTKQICFEKVVPIIFDAKTCEPARKSGCNLQVKLASL